MGYTTVMGPQTSRDLLNLRRLAMDSQKQVNDRDLGIQSHFWIHLFKICLGSHLISAFSQIVFVTEHRIRGLHYGHQALKKEKVAIGPF